MVKVRYTRDEYWRLYRWSRLSFNYGFADNEAEVLSRVPFKNKGMRKIIRRRVGMVRDIMKRDYGYDQARRIAARSRMVGGWGVSVKEFFEELYG